MTDVLYDRATRGDCPRCGYPPVVHASADRGHCSLTVEEARQLRAETIVNAPNKLLHDQLAMLLADDDFDRIGRINNDDVRELIRQHRAALTRAELAEQAIRNVVQIMGGHRAILTGEIARGAGTQSLGQIDRLQIVCDEMTRMLDDLTRIGWA